MRVDPSWQDVINVSLEALHPDYRYFLNSDEDYFPRNFLAPFCTLPREKTKAILFGQDPYPREKSATGYAFIDGMVDKIFSDTGFSKSVNRATSLRNFLKMQLINEGYLNQNDTSQEAIAAIHKHGLIETIEDLRNNFENEGILLLNTAPIFTCKSKSAYHVKQFAPFMRAFLKQCAKNDLELILFGKMADSIVGLLPKTHNFSLIRTPHPYNVGFIHHEDARAYFRDKSLIKKP
jgi:uracil-DNA glycosylase